MKAAAMLLPILLPGCTPSAHSVAYYKQNAAARAAKLDGCIAADEVTDDCRNVKQAEFEARGLAASNGTAEVRAR